jgi:iron complex outermembrane receptor protein
LATATPLETPASPRLTELFQRVPGLIAQDSFGGFDPPRLAVRGSGLQSAPSSRGLWLSFHGMPLNAADGSFNLALLESEWLEAVNLTRGTAAGVPALGGALAFGADPFNPGARLAAAYGSDNAVSIFANGTHLTPHYALAGRAGYTATDGWRPHSRQERESVFAATRTVLDEHTDLTIQFLAARPWYEVPGPLTKSAALNTPTAPQAAVVRDRPRRETEYAQLAARATTRRADAKFSLALGGVSSNDAFYQLQANGVSVTDGADAYLQFNAEYDWNAGQVWNLLGQHTEFSALLQSGWWDSQRYRNDRGEKGKLIGDHRLRPLTLTAALDHRLDLAGNQHLDLGGSLLTARRDLDDHFTAIPGSKPLDLDVAGTRFAPRIAWSWDFAADTTLTASWSRSYEPPTYYDLIYPDGPAAARVLRTADLAWQSADTYELGCQGRSDRFAWSAFLYYAPWHDEFLRLANADGSTRGTVNAGDTIHSGFESSLEYQLYRHASFEVTANATYTYTDARFDDDPVYGDRRLAGVPPHTGYFGLRAVSPGGWFIAPGCQLRAGETYADHANNLGYGGTALWSLELGRRHPDGWGVSLGIQNLFDSETIASTSGVLDRAANPAATAIFLPAAGRTVSLRLNYNW